MKCVRRDQIYQLPLPDFLHSYLDTPYYYSEELANLQESMKREKMEGKREINRRKMFMKTDQRTLMSKMLINREQIEAELNIVLPTEQGITLLGAVSSDEEGVNNETASQ